MYYKELAHIIMEAGNPEFALKASRSEAQESHWCRWSLKTVYWRIPSYSGEVSLFVLFSLSTD